MCKHGVHQHPLNVYVIKCYAYVALIFSYVCNDCADFFAAPHAVGCCALTGCQTFQGYNTANSSSVTLATGLQRPMIKRVVRYLQKLC